MGIDAYENSVLLNKIIKRKRAKKPIRIAFLDIDSTMTGSQKTSNTTRNKLERLGYIIVYVTARTEEMLMSSTEYHASKKYGFDRPQPHLGRQKEKRIYAAPEEIEAIGILNPDIIAGSSGTQILVRQVHNGYMSDKTFVEKLGTSSEHWRLMIEDLIKTFNVPEKQAFYALYDNPANYEKGLSDVYQPKYRITLTFQSAKQKSSFRAFLRRAQKENPAYTNISLTDDSEPKKELYVLYLTPKNGSKTKAVDHIIETITKVAKIKKSELHVLIAGDGHADFDMGIKAAKDTNVTFILAGGSRLTHALTCSDEHPEVLDEELLLLRKQLNASTIKGHYSNLLSKTRNFIICDEIYLGKTEVASILSYIEDAKLQ